MPKALVVVLAVSAILFITLYSTYHKYKNAAVQDVVFEDTRFLEDQLKDQAGGNISFQLHNLTDFYLEEATKLALDSSLTDLYLYLRDQFAKTNASFVNATLNRMYSLMAQSAKNIEETRMYRKERLAKISSEIQDEIYRLQHPQNCSLARRVICDFNAGQCGLNCELHRLAYCFIYAYYTKRTAILNYDGKIWIYTSGGWNSVFLQLTNCSFSQIVEENERVAKCSSVAATEHEKVVVVTFYCDKNASFLPPAVPKKYAKALASLHSNPFAFFVSQFKQYFMRLTDDLSKFAEEVFSSIPFDSGLIVGIHVRRTDKLQREAKAFPLSSYMDWAEEWFKVQDIRFGKKHKRRVVLATDEPKVIAEAKKKYSDYEIYANQKAAASASTKTRYSLQSLRVIITDVLQLSRCDYLVCTFSSGVCRLSFDMMQARLGDVGNNFHSLDYFYQFPTQDDYEQVAVENHEAETEKEIDLRIGDTVRLKANGYNGYSIGVNTRTNQTGSYPSYKVSGKWSGA